MPTYKNFFTRPSFDRQLSQYSGGTGQFSGSSIFKEFVDIGTPLANLDTGVNYETGIVTYTNDLETSTFTSTTSSNNFLFTGAVQNESYRLSAITESNSGETQTISLRYSGTTTYSAEGNTYYDDYTGVSYTFAVSSMSGTGVFYTGTCFANTITVYSALTHNWIRRKSGSTVFLAVSGGTETDRLFVGGDSFIGGNLNVTGDTTIQGNLSVVGTSTILETETILAEDNNIDLNYGGNNATAEFGGIRLLYGQDGTHHSSLTADTNGRWVVDPSLSSSTATFSDLNVSATTTLTGQLKYTNGTPGAGKLLQSDASGNASWETQSSPTPYWSATTTGHIVNSGTTTFVGIGTTGTPTFNLFIDEPSTGTTLYGDTTKKVSGIGFHWGTDKAFIGLMTGDTTTDTNQINTIISWGDDTQDKFQLGHYYNGDTTWRPGLTAQYNNTEGLTRFGFNIPDPDHPIHISGKTVIESVISGTSDLYIDGVIHPGLDALADVSLSGTNIVLANMGPGNSCVPGTGNYNFIAGYEAIVNGVSGNDNIAIGYEAGRLITGASSDNIILGKHALYCPGTASPTKNIMIGYRAGYNLYSNTENVMIGYQAGDTTTGDDHSVIIGAYAGMMQMGDHRTIIGYQAGKDDTGYVPVTQNPVYLGSQAGYNLVGSGNIAIGYKAGYSGDTTVLFSGTSNIIIGSGGIHPQTSGTSNSFLLGKSGSYLLSGDYATANRGKLGINISNEVPVAALHVRGSGTTTGGTTLLLEDSSGADLVKITDDGTANFYGDLNMCSGGTPGTLYVSSISGCSPIVIGAEVNIDGSLAVEGGTEFNAGVDFDSGEVKMGVNGRFSYGDWIDSEAETTIDARFKNIIKLTPDRTPSPWTVTSITHALEGQQLILLADPTMGVAVTIQDNANMNLNGTADFVMSSGDTLTLVASSTMDTWYETGRMVR